MNHTKLDVVTVAAVNLNYGGSHHKNFTSTPEYIKLMKNKMRLMFSLAIKNDCENLILGAWGCGVFKNDPYDVAEMFKKVTQEYNIKNVVFAIINDHNSVDDNYSVFKRIINR